MNLVEAVLQSYANALKYSNVIVIFFIALIFLIMYIIDTQNVEISNESEAKKSNIHYMVKELKYQNLAVLEWFQMLPLYTIICVFYYAIIFLIYTKYSDNFILIKDKMDTLEPILVAITAMTITVIIFVKSLTQKEYYLFFTKDDVLRKNKVGHMFYWLFGTCLLSAVATFISILIRSKDKNSNLNALVITFYVSVSILNLFVNLIALIIVAKIAFSTRKFELKMLRTLHKYFEDNRQKKIIKNHLDTIASEQNISFLIYEFVKLVRKRKINKIIQIQEAEFIDFKTSKGILLSAKKKFKVFFIVMFLISYLIAILSDKEIYQNYFYWVGQLVTMIIVIFLERRNIYDKYVANFMYSFQGYELTILKKKIYVNSYPILRKKIYMNYIEKCKNIVAFYVMLCEMENNDSKTDNEQKQKELEKLFKESIDEVNNTNEIGNNKNILLVLPFVISGYFFHLKYKIVPLRILDYFKKQNLKDSDKKILKNVMRTILIDVYRIRTFKDDENCKDSYEDFGDIGKIIDEKKYFEKFL